MYSGNRHSDPGTIPPENDALNNRPTVAILAQAVRGDKDKQSYIVASYVKYIESAGARVIPIPTNIERNKVEELFSCVNGLLIPGGAAKLPTSTFFTNAKIFYDLAIKANQKGDHFPIWGTCLGFETLSIIAAGTKEVLASCDVRDVALPLTFTPEAAESRLFRDMPSTLHTAISSEDVTYHFHKFGLKPDVFNSNDDLRIFFKVLSTNLDRFGESFVSTIEGFCCLIIL